MPNFLSSTAQQQKLGLTIISANAVDDQTVIVSMSLRNLGTKAINGVNISILNVDVNISRILTPLKASIDRNNLYLDLSINPLAPGQEIPIVIEVKSKIIAIGQKINIVVICRWNIFCILNNSYDYVTQLRYMMSKLFKHCINNYFYTLYCIIKQSLLNTIYRNKIYTLHDFNYV
jgi:hypothetical protein